MIENSIRIRICTARWRLNWPITSGIRLTQSVVLAGPPSISISAISILFGASAKTTHHATIKRNHHQAQRAPFEWKMTVRCCSDTRLIRQIRIRHQNHVHAPMLQCSRCICCAPAQVPTPSICVQIAKYKAEMALYANTHSDLVPWFLSTKSNICDDNINGEIMKAPSARKLSRRHTRTWTQTHNELIII